MHASLRKGYILLTMSTKTKIALLFVSLFIFNSYAVADLRKFGTSEYKKQLADMDHEFRASPQCDNLYKWYYKKELKNAKSTRSIKEGVKRICADDRAETFLKSVSQYVKYKKNYNKKTKINWKHMQCDIDLTTFNQAVGVTMKYEQYPSMGKNFKEAKNYVVKSCKSFVMDRVRPKYEKLATIERKKELATAQAKKEKKAKKYAEKAKAAASKKAMEGAKYEKLVDIYHDKVNTIVWGRESAEIKGLSYIQDGDKGLDLFAYEIVKAVKGKQYELSNLKSNISHPPFVEPTVKKGEFEKTSEFEKRKVKAIAKSRKGWEKKQANNNAALKKSIDAERNFNKGRYIKKHMDSLMLSTIGRPVVKGVEYDADKELFKILVTSEKSQQIGFYVSLPVAIKKAKSVKKLLKNMTVDAIISVNTDNSLKPIGAVFRNNMNMFHGKAVSAVDGTKLIDTSNARAENYQAMLKKQAILNAKNAKQKAAEIARFKQEESEKEYYVNSKSMALCESLDGAKIIFKALETNNYASAAPLMKLGKCITIQKGMMIPVTISEKAEWDGVIFAKLKVSNGAQMWTTKATVWERK